MNAIVKRSDGTFEEFPSATFITSESDPYFNFYRDWFNTHGRECCMNHKQIEAKHPELRTNVVKEKVEKEETFVPRDEGPSPKGPAGWALPVGYRFAEGNNIPPKLVKISSWAKKFVSK